MFQNLKFASSIAVEMADGSKDNFEDVSLASPVHQTPPDTLAGLTENDKVIPEKLESFWRKVQRSYKDVVDKSMLHSHPQINPCIL